MIEVFSSQIQTNLLFMTILIVWVAINISGSFFAFFATQKKTEMYYFLLMNILFNVVSGVIAFFGYASLTSIDIVNASAQFILERSIAFENVLIFNAGLDIAYLLVGVLLLVHQNEKYQKILKGFGLSVIIQAVFLFFLDVSAFISNQIYTNDLISRFVENMF